MRPLTADLGGLVSPFHDNTLNLIGKSLTLEPDNMVLSILARCQMSKGRGQMSDVRCQGSEA
ncbi:MAG: hypothetical protein FWC38_09670 [Proteobacteria bacterium]|nr:hypothetical protein [Pseudomonadota bacterium]